MLALGLVVLGGAVLHVDPAGLTLDPLSLGSSRTLAVGDALAVVGERVNDGSQLCCLC